MAEKEGKNINTALKGVLGDNDTLIGLVGGNVRQIETDKTGGLMTFDKGVSKSDINIEGGVTGFNPIGEVKEGDKRAVSGEEVYKNKTDVLNYSDEKPIISKAIIDVLFNEKGDLFNKENIIKGFYINTNNGSLVANDGSVVSELILIEESSVNIVGRTGYARELRWIDADGNILKPIYEDGTESNLFETISNGKYFKPPTAKYLQFTLSVVNDNYDNVKVYYDSPNFTIKKSLLPFESSNISVIKNNNNIDIIQGNFKNSIEIRTDSKTTNSSLNFKNVLHKNVVVKAGSDDISPFVTGSAYIGGNHGWGCLQRVTSSGHGKTFSDIGSVFTDQNSKEFIIVNIDNSNALVIMPNEYITTKVTQLFYKSGGSSNSNIAVQSASVLGNYYNFTKNRLISIVSDGVDKKESSFNLECSEFRINEVYDIIHFKDLFTYLQNNTFSSNVDINSLPIKPFCSISNCYIFKDNIMEFESYISAYGSFRLKEFSGLQDGEMLGDYSFHIPYVKEKNGLDFTKGVKHNAFLTDVLIFKTDWKDQDYMPNRATKFNSSVQITTGYLDNYFETSNASHWIYTTKKTYPYGFRYPTNESEQLLVNPNDCISIRGYRSFNEANSSYVLNVIRGSELHIYVDILADNSDYVIKIDNSDKYLGRKIAVNHGGNLSYDIFNGTIIIKGNKGDSFDIITE